MRSSSRRTTKLIGGALFAAAIAATSVATVSTVSADIGDSGGDAFIRVAPTNFAVDYEYQDAPVVQAPGVAVSAASVQIMIPSDWESGDKITLQVQADAAGFAPGSQTNCLSAAQAISFAGPYVVADTAVAGPWTAGLGWQGPDAGTDANTNLFLPDIRTPDVTPSVAPSFNVALTTSPSCGGVGVTDQIEITFNNTATVVSTDVFQISFNNIRYNIGALVNVGPVHVIPFAREAVDAAPGTFLAKEIFSNNNYDTAFVDMWTNNAFVSPVGITTAGTSIVADGYTQPLGTVTLTELAPDALGNGQHWFQLPSMWGLSGTLTVAITGNAGATGFATISGNYVYVTLAGMNALTAGTVVVSGLNGYTYTDGPIVANLIRDERPAGVVFSAGRWPQYLEPDDQTQGGSTFYSDVNYGADPSSTIGVAYPVPSRIGGNDRYETSAKIAANVSSCTEWAVVVSGSSYPDALSANYLAGSLQSFTGYNVPVLLSGTDSIPASIAAYMSAAGVKNVYIVGGTSAVSSAVQTALQATAATKCTGASSINSTNPVPNQKLNVVRLSGADRYATNRAVVNAGSQIGSTNRSFRQLELLQPAKRTAIVATGNSFADALAAGGDAYLGLPLILTDGTSLSANAKGALTDLDITQVIVIGGTAAVSDAVKAEIEAINVDNPATVAVEVMVTGRVNGADRYATATAWADFQSKPCVSAAGFDCGLGWSSAPSSVLLASGTSFADALSGGPLSAGSGRSIILTDPAILSAATQTWLAAHKVNLSYITVLGLGSAVSTGVMNAANSAIS